MSVYSSDLRSILFRALEALDKGRNLPFEHLEAAVNGGDLRSIIEKAGSFPGIEIIPDHVWVEINNRFMEYWFGYRGGEQEAWWVGNNGYCLLIALVEHMRKLGVLDGEDRPPTEMKKFV
jgi:hypothetical protein